MLFRSVLSADFPIIKQNNAILAFNEKEAKLAEPTPCVRCGRCLNACPMGLSPVEIVSAFEKNDVEDLNALMTDLCIGCGTCSFVCPTKRPLAQTMSLAKIAQRNGGKK